MSNLASEADNLRHWEALRETDPAHTKPFDRGRFKGTATKPIENERRLTEHFGPCGVEWGMGKPEFTLVPAGNELVVYCTVSLWYRDGEDIGTVYGVGGDKVIRIDKTGPFISDEAYKSAFTDALGNAMKHIGVNADIHSGEFDKYAKPAAEPPPARPAPTARPATAASPNGAETLSQIRDRVMRDLGQANDKLSPDDILRINQAEMALIKGVAPKTHARIIALAEERKHELAGTVNVIAESQRYQGPVA